MALMAKGEFVCRKCNMKFKTMEELHKHMKQHTL
jgi:hypothetical protein